MTTVLITYMPANNIIIVQMFVAHLQLEYLTMCKKKRIARHLYTLKKAWTRTVWLHGYRMLFANYSIIVSRVSAHGGLNITCEFGPHGCRLTWSQNSYNKEAAILIP